jgi:hypothetical protein
MQIETIPPITDPLGRHWEQPDPSQISIDETHALMEMKDFDKLHDYSISRPTAIYVGKMWKTYWPKHDRWYLHFIGPNEKPDTVTEHTRQIIVI